MKVDIKEFPLLLNDSSIKYFFKNLNTRKWVIKVINHLTKINLTGYEIFDNELNTGNNMKDYRMDLVFKKENNFVIVEADTRDNKYYTIKDYQYLFRLASNTYATGEAYTPKYITLIRLINDTKYDKLLEYKFRNQYGKSIDMVKSYEIYLGEYQKMAYNKVDEMDRKVMMLAARSKEELEKLCKSEEDKIILKELEELAMNEEFMGLYYDAKKVNQKIENSIRLEAEERGIKKGIKAGIEQEKSRNIRNMYADNLPIELIAKCTNTTPAKVKEILSTDNTIKM